MSAEPQSAWEVWTRRGISAAGVATSLGFYTAKKTTQIGFGIARGVTTTVVTLGSSLLTPITPIPPGAGLVIASSITHSLNLIEQLALLPLDIGQALTSTSLTLASSSIDVLTSMFGTHEASFSLAEFVTLVRREWKDPVLKERLPEDKDKYGVLSIGKALVAWAALQCATRGWHEDRWRANMREIGDEEWTEVTPPPPPPKDMDENEKRSYYHSFSYRMRNASMISRGSRVFVREDLHLPGQGGQILSAEIGEKWDTMFQEGALEDSPVHNLKMGDIRLNLRRLSKMVLGGYGGASLLFFGVPYPGKEPATDPTKSQLSKGKAAEPTTVISTANVSDQDLKEEEEVIAQLVHDADDEEMTAGSSTLAHSRTVSMHSRYPTSPTQHYQAMPGPSNINSNQRRPRLSTTTISKGTNLADIYPNSPGGRAMTRGGGTSNGSGGTVPFPSVSTTELPSSPTWPAQPTFAFPSSPTESIHTPPATIKGPSWWEMLSGKRDQEIFEGFAAAAIAAGEIKEGAREAKKELNRDKKLHATIGAIERMPRFWVLTDHTRRQVVLVIRGTMSLNELAVDLTCEPMDFEPNVSQRNRRISTASLRSPYLVHSGMYKMAQVMGGNGGPVHSAVRAALRRNRGYELVMSGHSLGAAVAGLLALMWADPTTCLTVPLSGLPVGRRVSAYCIAPPCFTSAELSRLSNPMITSFVYSHDVVSRLSLGSIRDLSRACWWLSDGKGEESCANVIKKSWGLEISTGLGWWGKESKKEKQRAEDKDFLLSLRKTLEANMHMADLFPAGNVFWAVHENDIDPSALPSSAVNATVASSKLRLFQVERVEKVFDQVVFSRDMLSSHMPHNYDRMLHEYL
ncbi:hypothetical protein CPB86DRAFT_787758 [Serendipita vermifera]|nr:hypothetical protein CPB86DRAFT_787758 [Serendipita vermifera]